MKALAFVSTDSPADPLIPPNADKLSTVTEAANSARATSTLGLAPTAISPIHALSVSVAQTRDSIPSTPLIGRPFSARHLAVTSCAALVVGAVVAFSITSQHRCTATIGLPRGAQPAQVSLYHAELLACAWDGLSRKKSATDVPPAWSVELIGSDSLRLSLVDSDRIRGIGQVAQIAQQYADRLRRIATSARAAPTDAERVVAEYVTDLQSRLTQAQAQADAATRSLPPLDPTVERPSLVARWNELRGQFEEARAALGEAVEASARLESQPDPTHGVVLGEERNSALQADKALQQDLRELQVALAETKQHLVAVPAQADPKLDWLVKACAALIEVTARHESMSPGDAMRATVMKLHEESTTYRSLLDPFHVQWKQEFLQLRECQVDALSGDLLDRHLRIRTLLNGFLFEAEKRLTALRAHTEPSAEGWNADARFYVLQSELTRAFQSLQTAHHQFAFAAGGLDARENFRLDSSLNRARGLRRRTQERLREIDERLQRIAVERARESHAQAKDAARAKVVEVRQSADRLVEELVSLQDGLNLSSGHSEEFLRASLQVEAARAKVQVTKGDLARREAQLKDLTSAREANPDAASVEVMSTEVSSAPINLGVKLRTGILASLLTLTLLLAGQWWMARRAG